MYEEEKKSLGRQRGAVKSKLTLFSNHLKTLEDKSLSEANIINLEERIPKADAIFTDFDNLQNQIQNLISESEMEAQHQERAVFEDTFFAAIASAKQIVLKYKREHEQQISANASTDVSSNHDEKNVQVLKGVEFPVISLPKFDDLQELEHHHEPKPDVSLEKDPASNEKAVEEYIELTINFS
ncbi:hypothetical protein JTB14_012833 [Gonioctena quinquepunctata]|nr:hypothetical protein JTB14_012833 [Gonioctena quinquepunctata]